MARVSTCLNIPRETEAAFEFYRSVFRTEFDGPIHRFSEVSSAPGQPPMAEGGKVERARQEMSSGDCFGSLTDRFGVQRMFNCTSKT